MGSDRDFVAFFCASALRRLEFLGAVPDDLDLLSAPSGRRLLGFVNIDLLDKLLDDLGIVMGKSA